MSNFKTYRIGVRTEYTNPLLKQSNVNVIIRVKISYNTFITGYVSRQVTCVNTPLFTDPLVCGWIIPITPKISKLT